MSEVTVKLTNKAIAIIADYIQRASKNEQLQDAKNRLDKKIAMLSEDENCDQELLMAAFVPAMTNHTRDGFFEAIAVARRSAGMNKKMEPSLQYACKRILELEQLLLVDVPETVWPAEVAMVFSVENAGNSRRTTSADCSTISTACGWKKCRYRQLSPRPVRWPAPWRNTRERGEIIVDNFAGGGGASTGIELAIGRSVDIAINHDPTRWRCTPPTTRIRCTIASRFTSAKIATAGRRVGLAWFSPDCRHFSKAKGAKPVEKAIRGLAWIVIRWALDVGPRVMMLENVEEFKTWGRCWRLKCGRTRNASGKHSRHFVGMLTTGIPADHPALVECCEFLNISLIARMPPAGKRAGLHR
jgi:hypothetical protein